MNNLTEKTFKDLANIQDSICVSIYFPTHKSGKEVLNKEDEIHFKNELKILKNELLKRGMKERAVEKFLKKAKDLQHDSAFWRNQSEGLAVFIADDFLQYHKLPFSVASHQYISQGFYLRPLLPALSGNGQFYLLGLNLHHITFYEGNREGLREIYVEDLTPQRLEEVLGYDYKQKFFQFRSQHQAHGAATFHGHGEWKGEIKKAEILRFFREIDHKLHTLIKGKNIPLVVVGLDYLAAIYQKVNTYPHLLPNFIDLNPETVAPAALHKKVWNELYLHFYKERQEKEALLTQLHDTARTSFQIQDILPAAYEGRVDTLFLQQNGEVWGYYNPTTKAISIQEKPTIANTSLLNLVATVVIQNGGKVYVQADETMPLPYSEVNALYRY